MLKRFYAFSMLMSDNTSVGIISGRFEGVTPSVRYLMMFLLSVFAIL